MELHQTLRDLVTTYGAGVLGDAAGLRGMLDDVLDESAASPGEINLLVDAVRFDVLPGLSQLVDGGADPARAVEESGARLARERGGDDASSGSWAAAVLGYAAGKVPEAVVLRYRSQRPPSPFAPPSGPPLRSPVPPPLPPVQSPPVQSPLVQGPPAQSPPAHWPATPPPPTYAPPYAPARPSAPRRSRKALWIGGGLALLLVVGGVVGAVVATSGDGSTDNPTDDPTGTDLTAAGIQQRYASLGSNVAAGTSDCTTLSAATGESEALSCTVPGGTLQLTTYASLGALKSERQRRLDRRMGSLANNAGTAAYYSYDPTIESSSTGPALVYWDSESELQSATLSGTGSTKLAALEALFRKADAPVGPPTGVVNPVLSRFLGYWVDDSSCKPSAIYAKGETEELSCTTRFRGTKIWVSFGRFPTRAEDVSYRGYYQRQYGEATARGAGPRWVFTDSRDYLDGGARYTYVQRDTGKPYAVSFWDWHYDGCACWATAYARGAGIAVLDAWWTKALADSY
ncbi:hypothetical protein GCM10028801_45650 [Nocardioides maradonensis]